MKKTLKVLSLALVLVLTVVCFTACGNETAENTETKTLKIGTNAEFPPFEFIDSEEGVINEFAGIDMEIIKNISDEIGVKPVINNMDFDGLLIALSSGQIDAVIAGMTVTDERAEQVDFSEPYYTATQVMIVPADSTVASAKDIADLRIGVIDGYTGQTCVEELGYKFSGYKKGADAVLDLANGNLDVVVIDSATAEKFIGENKDLKIVKDSETFEDEQYAIAVKKGNKELLDSINKSIKAMKESGEIGEISAKYN